MRSIYDIWSVLHENLEDEIPKTVKSASELNYLLNQLFYCNGYKFEPEEKFEVNEFGDSHRYLLEFLMRISKAINKSNKITNVDYSNLLKKVFQSVYAQISDAETISKNWTNNNDDTMKLLYEKLGESHTLVRLFEKEIRKTNLSIKIRKK
jgi:uncharacterized protein (DUF2267 family)